MWTLVEPPIVAWLAVSDTLTNVAPALRLLDFASLLPLAVSANPFTVVTSAFPPREASVAPLIDAVATVSNGGSTGIGRSLGSESAILDSATPFNDRMLRL